MHVLLSSTREQNRIVLNEEEHHHASKVLRMKVGDQVLVLDGHGGSFLAEFIEMQSRLSYLKVIEVLKSQTRPYRLHIAMAPTKMMERFEWFLEKAVEVGIDEITPIITSRAERSIVKMQRVEKIVHAAMKQSMQAFLPQLNEACSWKEFMNIPRSGSKFIAHCLDIPKPYLLNEAVHQPEICILIGPEGDFSPKEIDEAIAKGFQPVSLGESRLRAETAGVIACAQVQAAWQIQSP